MASRTAMSRLHAVATRGRRTVTSVRCPPAMQVNRGISSTPQQCLEKGQKETSLASSSTAPPAAQPQRDPFEPALTLPRTHNHHVASLHLRAHGPGQTLENLQFFADFALKAGYALGIPLSRPASLPTRTSLWTVLRGPFVHKKSQENFQRRVHKRVIKVWDADVEVVERWLQFLRVHGMAGVGMRAEVYRNFPLSIGSSLLAASTSQLRSVPAGERGEADATLRGSEADSEKITRLARGIVEDEVATQDAESTLGEQQKQIGHSADMAHDAAQEAPEAAGQTKEDAKSGAEEKVRQADETEREPESR